MPDPSLHTTDPVPSSFRHVVVVVNPASGPDAPPVQGLRRVLREAGARGTVHVLGEGEAVGDVVQRALGDGADLVAACGGDGTVSAVAAALMHTGVPMAVLPDGSANVFAAELGLVGSDARAALEAVLTDNVQLRTVDMGRLGRTPFVLRVGVGLVASMTQDVSSGIKARFGQWAYLWTALRLRRLDPVRYRLRLDGAVVEVHGVACMICNSGNVGLPGLRVVPEVEVDDGELHVVVVRRARLRTLLALAGYALLSLLPGVTQRERHSVTLDSWPARHVAVEPQPAQTAARDGEPVEAGFPLEAEIIPGALRVAVPAGLFE
jgi:diacylglycerol kinase family enzyme